MADELNSHIFSESTSFSLLEDTDCRIDSCLAALLGISRSSIQKCIKNENLMINGKIITKASFNRLKKGSTIELELEPDEELSAEPQDIPLEILFENSDFLIVNKPAGMLVHPGAGHPSSTLLNGIVFHLASLSDGSEAAKQPRAGLVHRIDKDTSGILVVAKNEKTMEALSEKFSRHDIRREYTCFVWGRMKEERGTIETLHGRDPKNRLKFSPNVENGRRAVTHYEVVNEFPSVSELKITLETGRTHQIRMHMSALGHPIVNDELYGGLRKAVDPKLNKLLTDSGRQLLHAGLLGFTLSGRDYAFSSPLPGDMQAIKDYLTTITGD